MNLQFTDARDEIMWRWENTRLYWARSAYNTMIGGKIGWHFKQMGIEVSMRMLAHLETAQHGDVWWPSDAARPPC